MTKKHSHYFKPVPAGVTHIDVYRVLDMFKVTDPCVGHAIKKLLVAGGRGAGKDESKDIQEAMDSLARWQEMRGEDGTGPLPSIDGWIPWGDSTCPVHGELMVWVKCLDGTVVSREARTFNWVQSYESSAIVAYRLDDPAANQVPLPAGDGWIEWGGDECPVHGEQEVGVRFRRGTFARQKASSLNWRRIGGLGDIIAYHLVATGGV